MDDEVERGRLFLLLKKENIGSSVVVLTITFVLSESIEIRNIPPPPWCPPLSFPVVFCRPEVT